ncbi:MAG: hypothetical protein QI223_01990 [Candidatus Korarchaeota archaeon]|nr:hypothetical protein [Candidatus Korarchaeota archaeon]
MSASVLELERRPPSTSLTVGVAMKGTREVAYVLRDGEVESGIEVESSAAFAADVVRSAVEGADPRLLVFAPHSLCESVEPGTHDLSEFGLRFSEQLLAKLEESRVRIPESGVEWGLQEFLRDRLGGGFDLGSAVRVVPIESVGRFRLSEGGERVRFHGEPAWTLLRMILSIDEELSSAGGPAELKVETTHGLNVYIPILHSAAEVAAMSLRGRGVEVDLRLVNWEPAIGGPRRTGGERPPSAAPGSRGEPPGGSDPRDGSDLTELEQLAGVEEVTKALELARSALTTLELGGTSIPLEFPSQGAPGAESSSEAVLRTLAALACGMSVPALPLMHASLVRLRSLAFTPPRLEGLRDLRVTFTYEVGRGVRYRYQAADGTDISSPAEGFAHYLKVALWRIVEREGLDPPEGEDREETETYADPTSGAEIHLRLRPMGLGWVERVARFFESRGWASHLRTLCMEFGGLLSHHCDWMRVEGSQTVGVRYDVAVKEAEGSPVIVPERYKAGRLLRDFIDAAEHGRLPSHQVRHFRAHAGMIHAVVYRVDLDGGEPRFWYLAEVVDGMISDIGRVAEVCPGSKKRG